MDTTVLLAQACPAPPGESETIELSAVYDAVERLQVASVPLWLRPQTWKVLLGYLPAQKREWLTTVRRRRADYRVSRKLTSTLFRRLPPMLYCQAHMTAC